MEKHEKDLTNASTIEEVLVALCSLGLLQHPEVDADSVSLSLVTSIEHMIAEQRLADEGAQAPAHRIVDLPPTLAVEVVTGLIELANYSGSCRGYNVVLSSDGSYLEDVKYPEDRALPGYSEEALTIIAKHVKGK